MSNLLVIDIDIDIDIDRVTYGVSCSGSVLVVSGGDRSGVQAFLVSQLTGGLYGLTQLASGGLAVEDVAEESVLTNIRYQSSHCGNLGG